MAKKELKGIVKLVVPAKQANPAPPIGPALGAAGVNIAEFCKQFNDKTADKEPGMPIPCIITVYTDRSFEFIMKLPPVSYYIKKALKLKIGSHKPGRDFVGTITKAQIKEIAENKTIVYVSHDNYLINSFVCDKIYFEDGEIKEKILFEEINQLDDYYEGDL